MPATVTSGAERSVPDTSISAGDRIDIYLDDLNNGTANGDFGFGANTTLLGTLTPGSGKVTSIFGFTDVDRITFDQTTLLQRGTPTGGGSVPV